MNLSKTFMITEVRATGLDSFKEESLFWDRNNGGSFKSSSNFMWMPIIQYNISSKFLFLTSYGNPVTNDILLCGSFDVQQTKIL